MPNLVGVFRPGWSEEEIAVALRAQLTRVRTLGRAYENHVSASAGFGMALQDHGLLENGRQPASTSDGRFVLLLDGEVLNADELARKYRAELGDATALHAPQVCLRLIARHGPQIAHEFNGLFVIAVWDKKSRKLCLISDHFGFRPLFYIQRPGQFLFGTELKALRAADSQPAQIDEPGLFELFCYGSHFHDRTWISGYLRLPPASVLTVDESGVRTTPYWYYQYDEKAPQHDQDTYVTLFATLLDRAVERCMRGTKRIGIFLSGGYDSRSVAASIRPHHLPIPAFTFGYEESRDVRYARALSDKLGLEHRALTRREPYLQRYCRSIVWRTEGLLPFADNTSIRFHAELSSAMDVFLTGLLAEFSGSHTWPQLLFSRTREHACHAIRERFFAPRLPVLRRIFTPEFFRRGEEAARTRLRQSFEAVKDDHPLNLADSWNLIHMQPMRSYQAPSIDRHVMETRAPHMDFELVSFLLTIPPYARLEQRVYKKMIAYRFPSIRDVPCTNSGHPIDPRFFLEYSKMAARYAGRKLMAPVRRVSPAPPDLGRESDDIDAEFRAEPLLISDVLHPALEGGYFSAEVFNHAGIRAVIDEHYARRAHHGAILSSLITHALAHRFFIVGDFREVPHTIGGEVHRAWNVA